MIFVRFHTVIFSSKDILRSIDKYHRSYKKSLSVEPREGFVFWCPARESNSHGFLRTILSRLRLPFRQLGNAYSDRYYICLRRFFKIKVYRYRFIKIEMQKIVNQKNACLRYGYRHAYCISFAHNEDSDMYKKDALGTIRYIMLKAFDDSASPTTMGRYT